MVSVTDRGRKPACSSECGRQRAPPRVSAWVPAGVVLRRCGFCPSPRVESSLQEDEDVALSRLCPPGAAPVTSYACRKFRIQDQILDFGNSEAESCREGEAGASLFSVLPPGF